MNKKQERQAKHAMVLSTPEEQAEIYSLAVEIGSKVDGVDNRDGIEIVLMLGQYLAKHKEGIRE